MRRLRILSIILFIAALGCFGLYHFKMEVGNDTHPPVITMDTEEITISVDSTEEEILEGVTAEDNVDGDVTDTLFVEKMDNFSTDGTRTVSIVAYDQAGNVAKASRDIAYLDYTPPHFTLSAPLKFSIGTTNITGNMGAVDVIDGEISTRVKVTGKYTLKSIAGDYPMEFKVANDAGDVAYLTATVTLLENGAEYNQPGITLKEYLVYTTADEEIDAWDYLEKITLGNNTYDHNGDSLVPEKEVSEYSSLPQTIEKSDVRIKDSVDYTTPGCYEITYQYTYDDETGTTRLIVIVE